MSDGDVIAGQGVFNVNDLPSDWKFDLIIRKSRPFSQAEFERRQLVTMFGKRIFVATAEDIALSKLEGEDGAILAPDRGCRGHPPCQERSGSRVPRAVGARTARRGSMARRMPTRRHHAMIFLTDPNSR
jgi:hypothetical protein